MRLAVVGLGNLGGPLAKLLAEAGHVVVGHDANPAVLMPPGVTRGVISHAQMVFIVVPTPSKEDGTYDTRIVQSALNAIDPGPLIVIVSTVLPGDCDRLAKATGHKIVYAPEFVRLGFVEEDMAQPDFILVGASDAATGEKVATVLHSITRNCPPVARLELVDAELAKLAVNTFVTTKISYANMIGEIAAAIGGNAELVCATVGLDRRIGGDYLKPGGAYRGPCFPRDNRALSALARMVGTSADLAEATERINDRQEKFFPEKGDRGY